MNTSYIFFRSFVWKGSGSKTSVVEATKRLYELFALSSPQKTESDRFGELSDPNRSECSAADFSGTIDKSSFNVIAAKVNCTKQIFNSLKRSQLLIVR